MWVKLNTQVNVVPNKIGETLSPVSNFDVMIQNGWRQIDDNNIPLPEEGFELIDWKYIQDPNNETKAIIQPTFGLISDRIAKEQADELSWQSNKSIMLKTIENMYVSFLIDEWTLKLRQFNIIANDKIVTVENTDSVANMIYLVQLRSMDTVDLKPTYNYFASEFQRFKLNIEALGGIMSKVQQHVIN